MFGLNFRVLGVCFISEISFDRSDRTIILQGFKEIYVKLRGSATDALLWLPSVFLLQADQKFVQEHGV